MSSIRDSPPGAFELCPGFGGAIPLAIHELTCPCFDLRTRVAVAWICDNCDLLVGLVGGLFTSWPDAISARQRKTRRPSRTLLQRRLRQRSQPITPDCRQNITSESRRHGLKERRR
jgi:hypothetical protein